jgi:NADH:ubiquinone oxidoreductase subunit H
MFILYILILILRVLLMVAFLTIFERVCIAKFQRRSGPNILAFQGILQAIADALKLLTKEVFKRILATSILFIMSRIIVFIISILN